MKFLLACLVAAGLHSFEYEVQFENEQVRVAKGKLEPHEEVGLHRDALPKMVIALQGGTIRRFEADGTTTDVVFPTGVAVFRDIDPPDELHTGLNLEDTPMELLLIEFKVDDVQLALKNYLLNEMGEAPRIAS